MVKVPAFEAHGMKTPHCASPHKTTSGSALPALVGVYHSTAQYDVQALQLLATSLHPLIDVTGQHYRPLWRSEAYFSKAPAHPARKLLSFIHFFNAAGGPAGGLCGAQGVAVVEGQKVGAAHRAAPLCALRRPQARQGGQPRAHVCATLEAALLCAVPGSPSHAPGRPAAGEVPLNLCSPQY